jgi:hypothetical protein
MMPRYADGWTALLDELDGMVAGFNHAPEADLVLVKAARFGGCYKFGRDFPAEIGPVWVTLDFDQDDDRAEWRRDTFYPKPPYGAGPQIERGRFRLGEALPRELMIDLCRR